MRFTPTGINRGLDWTTFSLYLCLVLVGWLMIFTVGYEEGYHGINDFLSRPVGKQTIWIGLSFLTMFLLYFIDWKFFQTFSYLFYIVGLIFLFLVLFFGKKINGANSWFIFAGVSFQPSELAKLGTCLALSSYLSSFSTSMEVLKHQIIAIGLFIVPMFLILLQPDAGSALVFTSFMIMLYRAGLSANIYIIGAFVGTVFILALMYPALHIVLGLALAMILALSLGFKKKRNAILFALTVTAGTTYLTHLGLIKYALPLALVVFAGYSWMEWQNRKERLVMVLVGGLIAGSMLVFVASYAFNNVLEKHQQERINVWLNPSKSDPRGASYNLNQSKIAIGSGGPYGKGFLQGVMTKLEYVPEQFTDFIFCTIGEEQGFAGSFSIMVLFFLLLYRLVMIAERQRSNFSRFYCYGIAGILFIHFFINIGMTMGLMPIIGIPLPFISKGGSSLLIFSLMIGLVLKLDSNRFRI
ncbi:MAG: rod shape-determining protein RodA [Saprospiraceae bacterium]